MGRQLASSSILLLFVWAARLEAAEAAVFLGAPAAFVEAPEPAAWPLLLGGLALIVLGRAGRAWAAARRAQRPGRGGVAAATR